MRANAKLIELKPDLIFFALNCIPGVVTRSSIDQRFEYGCTIEESLKMRVSTALLMFFAPFAMALQSSCEDARDSDPPRTVLQDNSGSGLSSQRQQTAGGSGTAESDDLRAMLEYHEQERRRAARASDALGEARAFSSMGRTALQFESPDHDRAIGYFESAVEIGERVEEAQPIVLMARLSAAELALDLNQFERAQRHLIAALDTIEAEDDDPNANGLLLQVHNGLGQIDLALNAPEESKTHFILAADIAEQLNDLEPTIINLAAVSSIEHALGNDQDAEVILDRIRRTVANTTPEDYRASTLEGAAFEAHQAGLVDASCALRRLTEEAYTARGLVENAEVMRAENQASGCDEP